MLLVKGRLASWFLCLIVTLFAQLSFAQDPHLDVELPIQQEDEIDLGDLGPALAEPEATPQQYYTFDENQGQSDEPWATPQELIKQTFSLIQASKALSLLRWVLHDRPAPAPIEPYKRARHFGGWRRDPTRETCYNTRARVLIRDSRKDVTFTDKNNCVVESGLWKDPYTGELIESARQIQIDHVVALKNAYISGASRWTPQARCTYANFEANPEHLLSVSGQENMRKGDRTPAEYMPPDQSFACTYLQKWLSIKMTWQMFMSPEEVAFIASALKQYRCSNADMNLEKAAIRDWRQAMQNYEPCAKFTGLPRKKARPTQ